MFRVRLEKWDVIRNGTGFLVPLQRDRTEWGIYPGGTGPDIVLDMKNCKRNIFLSNIILAEFNRKLTL